MQEPIEIKHPFLRRVKESDYQRVWEIWMQDHIIQWMSFTKKDLESFKATFDRLNKQSDVYVLVDLIDDKETIVGVRRIKYLSGPYEHVAEFCSMGVDGQYLNKGYGKVFWKEFEDIVKQNPKVKCIRFTQSGGNNKAFHLSDSIGYKTEAVFPDWLQRSGEAQKSLYYLIERFSYKIIDSALLEQSKSLASKKYEPKLPPLVDQTPSHLTVQRVNNKIQVLHDKNLVLDFDYYPDESVIQHIGFLEDLKIYQNDKKLCTAALRLALNSILTENRVKKLELFTHDDKAIELCAELGFWIRGERPASYCQDGKYFNELGVEYSFFGIEEALSLFNSFKESQLITAKLNELQQIINHLEEKGVCDSLGKNYLANIVYQIVRDELLEQKLFVSLEDKPWEKVLPQCPEVFAQAAKQLQSALCALHKPQKEETKASQIGIFSGFQSPSSAHPPDAQKTYDLK
ncbi:putative acetyltransferase YhhY [Legionella steigerwaltii]|uniref:Acetyltransferase YhhY n=2 Tax=Legionella steigerwaltii TaxID=460 RepID=A0A378LJ66_9GAMM|nr:putative acetyltransferase YhhY [Legionella steigerwaltii]STY24131.1 putative acetyltransferase YhhY [Legionella steigerwaltii]